MRSTVELEVDDLDVVIVVRARDIDMKMVIGAGSLVPVWLGGEIAKSIVRDIGEAAASLQVQEPVSTI